MPCSSADTVWHTHKRSDYEALARLGMHMSNEMCRFTQTIISYSNEIEFELQLDKNKVAYWKSKTHQPIIARAGAPHNGPPIRFDLVEKCVSSVRTHAQRHLNEIHGHFARRSGTKIA